MIILAGGHACLLPRDSFTRRVVLRNANANLVTIDVWNFPPPFLWKVILTYPTTFFFSLVIQSENYILARSSRCKSDVDCCVVLFQACDSNLDTTHNTVTSQIQSRPPSTSAFKACCFDLVLRDAALVRFSIKGLPIDNRSQRDLEKEIKIWYFGIGDTNITYAIL